MHSSEPLGLQANFSTSGVSRLASMPYLESLGILVSDSHLYLSTSIDGTQTKVITINNLDASPCNLTSVEVINVSGVTTNYTVDVASASEIVLDIVYSPLDIVDENGIIRLFFNNTNIIDVAVSTHTYVTQLVAQSIASVDFGRVSYGEQIITLTNLTNSPVVLGTPTFMLDVLSDTYVMDVAIDDRFIGGTIAPNGTYDLKLVCNLPVKEIRTILVISASSGDYHSTVQVYAQGNGNINYDTSANPELIYSFIYSEVTHDVPIKFFLKATNYEPTTLHVDSYSFEGLHATDTCTVDFVNALLVTTIPPYSEIAVSVTYTPSTSELHLPTLILSGARD